MKIGQIISIILGVWNPEISVVENVLATIVGIGKAVPEAKGGLVGIIFAEATAAENALQDLAKNNYAIAGDYTVDGKTYSCIIVENGTPVGALFGV